MEIEQYVRRFSADGEAIVEYTMLAADGAAVTLTNLGAAVTAVRIPDRSGRLADVLAAGGDPEPYRRGRRPPGTVSGLRESLERAVWMSRVETDRVVFSLASPDGTDGYEGNLDIEVVCDWNDEHELEITYLARSDAKTALGLVSRLAFDLSSGSGFFSQRLTAAGREMHLREIPEACIPLPAAETDILVGAARLAHAASGRTLDVYTTYPALYTGILETGGKSSVSKGVVLSGCENGLLSAGGPSPLTPGDVYAYRTAWIFGIDRP